MDTFDEDTGLDPKQLAFINEYLVDRNGTQAAIRAGFTGSNPAWWAWKTLKNPLVRAMVDQLTADKLAAHGIRADTVMQQYAAIIRANIGDFIDGNGDIDVTRVPKDLLWLVDSYSVSESEGAEGGHSRSVRIKMLDKHKALEKVAKYLGLVSDTVKVDLSSTDGTLSPIQQMTDEELRAEAEKRGLPTDIFGS